MTVPISGGSFVGEPLALHSKAGVGKTAAGQADLLWYIKPTRGKLVTRYDWYADSYIAFLTIACFMVTLARILE
jgi:hypothetical protein